MPDIIQNLLATKQLSVYLILLSLVITAAMMHPGFATLMFALPANAMVLFLLRWVAHHEGANL